VLREIVRFELARHVRAISTYVYFLLFGALGFLMMLGAAGGISEVSVNFGSGGKVYANSPWGISESIGLLSYFGLLVIAAFCGRAAYQDFDHKTDSFFFTSRAGKGAYLGGRYAEAVLLLTAIFSSLAIGMFLATLMPTVDRQRLEANHVLAYVQPYLVTVIPNVIVMGALFFSLAALARRIFPVYMASVLLLMGYLLAGTISHKIEHKFLASLVDPFGASAMEFLTEYWTIAEKNTRLVPLEGYLLWNRVLWLGVAAAVAAFTVWKFRFGTVERVKKKSVPKSGDAAGGSACATFGSPLLRLAWLHFVETVKNIYFAVIVLAGVLFMVVSARTMGDIYGTPTYPVTYQVIDEVGGTFELFMLIIITFYAGELIWRERDAGTHEIVDSLPLSGGAQFVSKLLALLAVQATLEAVVMATGMAIQLGKGYTRLEPLLYIKELFGIQLLEYSSISVLALTVQVLVNNKYLGHFLMVLYYLVSAFMGKFGLEHRLYDYGSIPDHTYSDMNRFGPYVRPIVWFDAYWAAAAVLLALAAHLLFVRGLAVEWRSRLREARRRFRKPQRAIAGVAAGVFVAAGSFIFYNTNVLNHYRTTWKTQTLAERYERTYKPFLQMPHPRITSVSLWVDLQPYRGSVRIRGKYEIANKTGRPIERFLLGVPEDLKIRGIRFTPPARLESEDRPLDVQVYRMQQPFPAGATGTAEFDLEFLPHGFANSGPDTFVVENGTFFNSESLPHFGYQEGSELSDDDTRRKHHLKEKPRMADIHDEQARRNNYISQDADWVPFEAVIATAPDQIAIAPGELVGEWSDGARHYFRYRTLRPVLDFFSVLSARYRVMRDRWNDVELGIYYQPGHEYNLAAMMKGMKQSLDYCTRNFSPYQNKTVRIVEFPRYQSFAQSFPATIPYSESIGFIARVDPSSDEDVDYPFYVTAHEVGHQWWAHQVIGANVQGATMTSESLAQYTAMMVMKHEYGPDHMKRFLKYEMDRYLNGRSAEKKKEMPLVLNEDQGYIHYQKASVVFYALQDYIGEDNVNRALRDYVNAVGFQDPPYTTALELEERLRAVTPPEWRYLIDDMFDSITLYENRAISATYREVSKGKYEVKLKVAARKLKAGELGEEKEVPLADWIDIGVLDAKDKPLYLERHKIEKAETEFTLTVDGVPAKAGIDPWNKLVDRKPDDNLVKVTEAR